MTKRILAVLLLLPILYAAAPQASAADPPTDLARARALLDAGKNEEAWQLLLRLVREEPADSERNLLFARASYATGRDNQGILAMERVVDLNPDDASLRRELAFAYAKAGDKASAALEMEAVRAQAPQLCDEDAMAKLEKYLGSVDEQKDRFVATGRLAAGIMWDSNVNTGIESLDVSVVDVNMRLDDKARKKASLGEFTNGTLNLGWKLGEDTPWWLAGEISWFGKVYDRHVPNNQRFGWARGAVGLRRSSASSFFQLRAHSDVASYQPWEQLTTMGGDMTWLYALTPNVQVMASAGLDKRYYMTNDGQSGTYWYAGGYARLLWGGEREHSLLAGARALGAEADADNYSYDGWEAIGRLTLRFAGKLDVEPYLAWRQAFFRDAATSLSAQLHEGRRHDDTFMSGVTLTWHWTEHLASEVSWQYTKNWSNSEFYRYDQHIVSTGLVLTF